MDGFTFLTTVERKEEFDFSALRLDWLRLQVQFIIQYKSVTKQLAMFIVIINSVSSLFRAGKRTGHEKGIIKTGESM